MADINEKVTLGKSAKCQHKYGTANRAASTSTYPDQYIKHTVQKDDTLPGIALKYGCSVRKIHQFVTELLPHPTTSAVLSCKLSAHE